MARWRNWLRRNRFKTCKSNILCGFVSHSSYVDKYVAFKTIMHEPMIVNGKGDIDKLSEIIGDNNVERLVGLDVIKESNGSFELTDLGKKFVEIFKQ